MKALLINEDEVRIFMSRIYEFLYYGDITGES